MIPGQRKQIYWLTLIVNIWGFLTQNAVLRRNAAHHPDHTIPTVICRLQHHDVKIFFLQGSQVILEGNLLVATNNFQQDQNPKHAARNTVGWNVQSKYRSKSTDIAQEDAIAAKGGSTEYGLK